jgi:hypothetical protein
MKVKTIAPHENDYGDKHAKTKGDTYDVPENVGQSLIAEGYVEPVDKPSTHR